MATRLRYVRMVILSLVGLSCMYLTSCGSNRIVLHPVTGSVLYEEKAAVGATVVFHLENGAPDAPKPAGVVGADGKFTLNTYPHGAGAPEGNYAVIVTWFEDSKNENDDPKSKISLNYSDPQKSGLKATIKAGTNILEPFRLTKQPR